MDTPSQPQSPPEARVRERVANLPMDERGAVKHATRISVEEPMARAPCDWLPGEADVDEFLGSIRGRNSGMPS